MEREWQHESDRPRPFDGGPPSGDSLNQQRREIDGLLRAADRVFDSIDHAQAHQYLEQNQQTGGQ